MGENSRIEWTDHTFNPWRGCTKVSEGCKFCYADVLSGRNPKTLGIWGPKGSRVIASEAYWREPLKWDRQAQAEGVRRRVFCASLADVFEGEETMPEDAWESVCAARSRLFGLIDATPHLDWLLLTKRPENIKRLWPFGWYDKQLTWPNVWLGTSIENQETADKRIPELLKIPAAVRFLSCEPLLAPVDLRPWIPTGASLAPPRPDGFDILTTSQREAKITGTARAIYIARASIPLHWVIAGGESGPNARPMHPDSARSLRDQCQAASVPFLFKQWGNWLPMASADEASQYPAAPMAETTDGMRYVDVGKKAAGRLLDGRTWDQFPEVAA